MPPRFAYWTILLDGLPTAFRAVSRDELLPTFKRLQEKHSDAVMKWFSGGALWDSPEHAKEARATARAAAFHARSKDWRPGGDHRDPRQKFIDAKKARNVERRKQRFERRQQGPADAPPNWKERPPRQEDQERFERKGDRPVQPRGAWRARPTSGATPEGRANWKDRPTRPKSEERRAGTPRPTGPKSEPRRDRNDRPAGPKAEGRRDWKERPKAPNSEGRRDWKDRPTGPQSEARRDWKDRPKGPKPPIRREWNERPAGPARPRGPRGPKR